MDTVIQNVKLLWSKTNRFHYVLLMLLLIELKVLPRGKTGFQCNDPDLSYPFTGDTISWKWLMAICSLLPLVVMLIVERKSNLPDPERANKRVLNWYKEYMFAYIVNLCVIQLLKLYVGSPRPHFFDTCMPQEASTCVGSEFITSYTCTKTTWNMQSDKSFPSGHSSLAIHAGLFTAYYLHKRLSAKSVSIQRALQASVLLLSVGCALSRVLDRRHHWSDVIGGAGIAAVISLYTIYHLCRNFDCSYTSKKTDEKAESSISNGSTSQEETHT